MGKRRHGKMAENCRAVLIAVSALLALYLYFYLSRGGAQYADAEDTQTCWRLDETATFLDPNHPKGWREMTLVRKGLHTGRRSLVVITGRNSPEEATFSIPARPYHDRHTGVQGLQADFSSLGGPSDLQGECKTKGDIVWSDGNRWARAVHLSELLTAASRLAVLAAEEIRTVHASRHTGVRKKAVTDDGTMEPVTMADSNANRILVNGYRSRFPGVAILSEERTPEPMPPPLRGKLTPAPGLSPLKLDPDPLLAMRDVLITIDPLDATKVCAVPMA